MNAATRRLALYAVLLLLPALAVGGLALGLLGRERARLVEREAAAEETRRAAVETRARLIAENIELLVGDVQAALIATLLEAPETEPRPFLTEWQTGNPLVRDVFRATADGTLLWGGPVPPPRTWRELAAAARGAERTDTAADVLVQSAPFAAAFAPAASSTPAAAASIAEPASEEIAGNVGQYQSARRELQVIARQRVAYAPRAEAGPASASVPEARLEARAFAAKAADSFAPEAASASAFAPEPVATGWTAWTDASGLRLLGWRRLGDGTFIGLELALEAIKARLGEVFPASPEAGEAYELRDGAGGLRHRVGPDTVTASALEVPLAALPGWRVTAGHAPASNGSAPGSFFALGAALVALLVLTIVVAGALLLRQARRSEIEATLKTSFVANVSHELKTPLTTIRLYAELLAQGRVRDEARRADYLATIGRETERLGRLVGNVLDFSRLEQGKKKYERVERDLAAELRRLADAHGPRLAEAGLALAVETPGRVLVATDRDAVEQIVLNLLDNACKYAADGGEVLLGIEPAAMGVRVVVADRGPGVPPEQRERIFEKFHRVDDRLTAEKPGAGLGLSIARQLAHGLGGDLVCREREGGGARFILTLPA